MLIRCAQELAQREPIITHIRLKKALFFEPNNDTFVYRRKIPSMKYIWQHKNWPQFIYDVSSTIDVIYKYALETSYLSSSIEHLPAELQLNALIDAMVLEAIKTSAIEGEKIGYEDIRSSIKKQLGLLENARVIKDPRAHGIATLMINVRKNYMQPLSHEELFQWHKMIFYDKDNQSEIGMYRVSKEPMQIISGSAGKEVIHFEAPPSTKIKEEMAHFIAWFNESEQLPGPIRAAIAHLYFECIHPFFDGNGRIGRALIEKILCQDQKKPLLLSVSTTIDKHKRTYYEELEFASKNGLDISRWIHYFATVIYQALQDSKKETAFIVSKARFWKDHAATLNDRKSKVMNRMFSAEEEGFQGVMSAQKYMNITGCSKATATRDLKELLNLGCIEQIEGKGRNTRYIIKLNSSISIF